MIYTAQYDSPLGTMLLASDGTALTALDFDDTSDCIRGMQKDLPVFEETFRWLDLYFSGKVPDCMPQLAPKGTAFQHAVWDILRTIPYGKTTTYGRIAAQLAETRGGRMSAQAVGGAVGRNPISILIPCHRVIGADGSLTGYAGGMERKDFLLRLEGSYS
ncbi:cysteine methyltransferase [Selenomonas sp. oral taxon 126]|uniref:methylated-DNA--[protein]-cysteine S-methyltransferase n=1 Tax=Selenomonas sp. oral taxon 126 TaxID=712528 RepID=UPI0008078F9A|nr:methylated-DNA--[protein]-cysteine S-methyltransferase [Selenomonas sp. oral taxon 126]ANR70015.1 cysteine methyltransferase [Selenomonas sp. oral taxon 126]